MLVRFPWSEQFEQFCQGKLSFSFAKVNCNARQHFSRLFFGIQSCDQYFFFFLSLCYKRIIGSIELWMHLGSLESTREARLALGYRKEQLLRFPHALQTSCMHP